MTDEQYIWLREHRCPWCKNRKRRECAYKVTRTYDGLRCWGYRCDEKKKVDGMTDNRTTELLHKLLDERGVEYFTDDDERAYDEPARTTWDFVLCGLEMTVTATEFVDVEGKTYLEMDFHHAFTPEQAIAATLGWIDEPDTIRNELTDGGLIADVLAPVCVDEKERRAFERGRVHERFAQQIFKEATS
jgi:hypothetical protein